MSFFSAVYKEIADSLGNNYSDNWDEESYDKERPLSFKKLTKIWIAKYLHNFGLVRINDFKEAFSIVEKEYKYFEYLYNILSDEQSKKLLVKLLCYRTLGHHRVKLPLNTSHYWTNLSKIDTLTDGTDYIDPGFEKFILKKYSLETLGYPIKLYFTKLGIMLDFIIKQYEYQCDNFKISADRDDIVIDGGGCWGDTSLYFSHLVGQNGKVYSFEFIPFNLELFRKNLSLNPNLNNVEIIENPLWSSSEVKIYFNENGPASKVSMDEFVGYTGVSNTICIDKLVDQKKINRIDFIKLDIEGAELMALRGAQHSIVKFKPKIAVALYHYLEDFESIPRFINELNLGYKFYLSHCTLNKTETILFATHS